MMKQLKHVVQGLIALQLFACGNDMGSLTDSNSAASAGPPSESPASTAIAGREARGGANSPATSAPAVAATSTPPSRPASGAAGAVAGSSPSAMAGAAGIAPTQPAAGTGAAGAAGSAPAAGAAAPSDPSACDRACLLEVMKSYQDALVAKDPSKLKVASNVKYSENGAVAMFGQTMVWKSVMSIVPETLLNFADTTVGNVASQFVYNDSAQKIYQVRLKVVNRDH